MFNVYGWNDIYLTASSSNAIDLQISFGKKTVSTAVIRQRQDWMNFHLNLNTNKMWSSWIVCSAINWAHICMMTIITRVRYTASLKNKNKHLWHIQLNNCLSVFGSGNMIKKITEKKRKRRRNVIKMTHASHTIRKASSNLRVAAIDRDNCRHSNERSTLDDELVKCSAMHRQPAVTPIHFYAAIVACKWKSRCLIKITKKKVK